MKDLFFKVRTGLIHVRGYSRTRKVLLGLLGVSLILLLWQKDTIEMFRLKQSTSPILQTVDVGTPIGYLVVIDYPGSYLFDYRGEPFLYFGVETSMDSSMGHGIQMTTLHNDKPLVQGVNIRWFSVTEDQFYEARMTFDQQALLTKLTEGEWSPYYSRPQFFFRTGVLTIAINVFPGGYVAAWVGSGDRNALVAQAQGVKVEGPDWATFADYTFAIDKPDRATFIKRTLENEWTPEQVREEVRTQTLPLNSEPWRSDLKYYRWRLSMNEPNQLKFYHSLFRSGDYYPEPGDQAQQTRARPIPTYIVAVFRNEQVKEDWQLDFDYDQELFAKELRRLEQNSGAEGVTIELGYDIKSDMAWLNLVTAQETVHMKSTAELSLPYNRDARE